MKESQERVVWIFHQAVNGQFGFIETSKHEEHIFVFGENKLNALDSDEVEAKIVIYKWRKEAIVTKILKRSDKLIMGEFLKAKKWDYGFLMPFNQALKQDIFIPWRFAKWAEDGQIVAIKITKREWKKPEWKIIKILWEKNNPESIINWYILEAWFKLDFPKQVKKEMQEISTNRWKEIKRRKDKRKLFTFTIDWEDAKDLDDAISIESRENGWYKLFVHIADVAHYVKNRSLTQQTAIARWTSVYLPHKVLPMLPPELSNDLCSLNPHTDKLSLSCEMHLDKNWNVEKHTVYESVINSDFRLTYEEVDKILDKKLKIWQTLSFGSKITNELITKLEIANTLKTKLTEIKKEQGNLWFDFPETKIKLDENLQVQAVEKYTIFKSNKMIEEFMVLANECVSRKFHKIPFLYRIHEKPEAENIAKLEEILKIFGINFNFEENSSKEFDKLLDKIQDKESKYVLERLILRSLKKAEYSDQNKGHFGLWLSYYSHFTSPIRRYPDYQIHRIIKLKLQDKLSDKISQIYKKRMEEIGVKCTEQEIKAQKLEWKVRDYFMTQFFKDKIWEKFVWMISGVLQTWIFIELDNTVEWFVELCPKTESLGANKNQERVLDKQILEFVNCKTKQKLRVWDKIEIKVKAVDQRLLRINFSLDLDN